MVHQYKLGGYNIVLDSCSGGVHVVDEVAYDIIALYEQEDRETIIAKMNEKYASREDMTRADADAFVARVQSHTARRVCVG